MENLNTVLKVVAENGNVKFPIIEKKSFLETDIFTLDLDTRSSNSLKRNGFNTIQEVLDNLDKLPRMRGCGAKSVNRILYGICSAYYGKLNPEEKEKYLLKIVELNTNCNGN